MKEIYALEEDLVSRGYEPQEVEGVELVGYSEAVELVMERYEKVITA